MSARKADRITVDLGGYPNLAVIYLGMRITAPRGLITLFRLGREIKKAVAEKPDGLLLHEDLYFSFLPLHVGMRQYWRDLDALERWTREGWHRGWWSGFRKDDGGTAFWHETYLLEGGFEAIYSGLPKPVGLARFADQREARGTMFSARSRLERGDAAPPVMTEQEIDHLERSR